MNNNAYMINDTHQNTELNPMSAAHILIKHCNGHTAASKAVGVTQATFSRIANGTHANPRWDTAWPIVKKAREVLLLQQVEESNEFIK